MGALPACCSAKSVSGDLYSEEQNLVSVHSNQIIEDAMDVASERAAVEAERAFLNQRVIDTAHLNIKSRSRLLNGKGDDSNVPVLFLFWFLSLIAF